MLTDKTMYLNNLKNFVKKFFLDLDHLFQEIDHDEKMYLAIINSLNKKIDFLENLLTEKEIKQIEVKNTYEKKMLYLVHINNILFDTTINLRKHIEHIENESVFTKFKKSFVSLCNSI
jgi:hypothetical protein